MAELTDGSNAIADAINNVAKAITDHASAVKYLAVEIRNKRL